MAHPKDLSIADFDYDLPAERIAQYPLEKRDSSRLLVYRNGAISADWFRNLPELLPSGSLLVFNQTKVIPARIFLNKPSGARIEFLCLEPLNSNGDYQSAMQAGPGCTWKCMVGNARRWKGSTLARTEDTPAGPVTLQVSKAGERNGSFDVLFQWEPGSLTFSEILERFGKMPLPPYIRRDAEESDKTRYQTIFAVEEGSIAAPTAGLHFTPEMMERLSRKGILTSSVNLHVGAGTFKPVTSALLSGHAMHSEFISIPLTLISQIVQEPDRSRILVGTTTVRALESLYWQGVRWMREGNGDTVLHVEQWQPYEQASAELPDAVTVLQYVADLLEKTGASHVSGHTSLIIAPGYQYKLADVIITNFHMPQSTLLLLVSAFIGDDWRRAYRFALDNEFRFLSYGDSCLFFHHRGKM